MMIVVQAAAVVAVLQLVAATTAQIHPAVSCDGCVPVFYAGLANTRCYRIPSVIKSQRGTLLAFAEDRGPDCGDDGPEHALVLRRSSDDGLTWGPVITVRRGAVPCQDCKAAISNPNPVEVELADGGRALLLHFDTLNNPRPEKHGLDMQLWSHDDGLTWQDGKVLEYPPQENMGAMIGPSVGLQDAEGTIFFSAHLAFSYWSPSAVWHTSEPISSLAATQADTAFLYWSKDYGRSWQASEAVEGLNECSIAWLDSPRDGRILMNCRAGGNGRHRLQLVWDGERLTNVTEVAELVDPNCQGSVLNHEGALYLSNIANVADRRGVAVRSSLDHGESWSEPTPIWSGPAAYSQLVALGEQRLGLLFEGGVRYPYESILFAPINVTSVRPDAPPAPPYPATEARQTSYPSGKRPTTFGARAFFSALALCILAALGGRLLLQRCHWQHSQSSSASSRSSSRAKRCWSDPDLQPQSDELVGL